MIVLSQSILLNQLLCNWSHSDVYLLSSKINELTKETSSQYNQIKGSIEKKGREKRIEWRVSIVEKSPANVAFSLRI